MIETKKRECSVNECSCKYVAKGYCRKHYAQFKKHGRILDRTMFDPNEIVLHNDYAEVVLYDRANKEIGRAIIDLDDVEIIKNLKWHLTADGYAAHGEDRLAMHNRVIGIEEGYCTDHINRNRLDNRKSNLRKVTSAENSYNKSLYTTNTSGITGIHWVERINRWEAYIQKDYKKINLGYFSEKEDAMNARKEAEILYFGDALYEGC